MTAKSRRRKFDKRKKTDERPHPRIRKEDDRAAEGAGARAAEGRPQAARTPDPILREWNEIAGEAIRQGEAIKLSRTDCGYSIELLERQIEAAAEAGPQYDDIQRYLLFYGEGGNARTNLKEVAARALEEGTRVHDEIAKVVRTGRLKYVSLDKEPGPYRGYIEPITDEELEAFRASGALDFPSVGRTSGPSGPEEVIRAIREAKERFREPGSYSGGPWDYVDYRPVEGLSQQEQEGE